MDFGSLLKGATDTLKKLETDVTKSAQEKPQSAASSQPVSSWNDWEGGDDDWEDVADVQPTSETLHDSKSVPNGSAPQSIENDNNKQDDSTQHEDQPVVPDAADHSASEDKRSMAALQAKLDDAIARANASERKVFALTRDRDALRRIRDAKNSEAELLKDKDKQITAILEEGQKLSVKIAEKESSVRTLKASLKECDTTIEDLRLSLSATEAKLEAAASRQRQLETSEKSAMDGIEAAERRLRQVESESRSKSSSSAALEAARAQLEALRKSQAAALENQAMRLRAEHETSMEALASSAKTQEDSLNKAMMELRAHLTQVVDNAGWREDQLRKEADELRKRAERLEERNDELAAALPNATKPLLRQVEALQAAATERDRAKSAVDRSQLERLRAAEAAVAVASERERAAEERIGSFMTRIASLEEQVKIAHGEQARLGAELHKVQTENAEIQLNHQKQIEMIQAQVLKANRDKELANEELSKERTSSLDISEAAEERERQLRSQLAATETKLEMLQERLTSSTSAANRGDAAGALYLSPRRSAFEGLATGSPSSLGFARSEMGDDNSPIVDSSAGISGMYATERLTLSLRRRNEEIVSLQSQLDSKEAATSALAEEVVTLTSKVDELTKQMDNAPELRKEFSELKRRHTALLELLGEREEKIMELEADLVDVNQMYKEQVTELLLRIEKMQAG